MRADIFAEMHKGTPLRERIARRVALALSEATADNERAWIWPDDFVGDTIERARDCADEIMTAIVEPTQAMIDATDGLCGGYGYGDECFEGDPREIWQAMVAAEKVT